MLPALEGTGLKVGEDFFLAFSPERVDPGNPKWNTRNTPKVVGGITETCRRVAVAIYGPAIERLVPRFPPGGAGRGKNPGKNLPPRDNRVLEQSADARGKVAVDAWEGV